MTSPQNKDLTLEEFKTQIAIHKEAIRACHAELEALPLRLRRDELQRLLLKHLIFDPDMSEYAGERDACRVAADHSPTFRSGAIVPDQITYRITYLENMKYLCLIAGEWGQWPPMSYRKDDDDVELKYGKDIIPNPLKFADTESGLRKDLLSMYRSLHLQDRHLPGHYHVADRLIFTLLSPERAPRVWTLMRRLLSHFKQYRSSYGRITNFLDQEISNLRKIETEYQSLRDDVCQIEQKEEKHTREANKLIHELDGVIGVTILRQRFTRVYIAPEATENV